MIPRETIPLVWIYRFTTNKPEQTLTFNDTDHIPISMDILDLRPEPTKPKQMLSMELPTIPEKFTGS